MISRLNDLLMLEAVVMVVAALCAAAMIVGIAVAIVYWPLSTVNLLLIAIAVLLWEILRVFRRIEGVGVHNSLSLGTRSGWSPRPLYGNRVKRAGTACAASLVKVPGRRGLSVTVSASHVSRIHTRERKRTDRPPPEFVAKKSQSK